MRGSPRALSLELPLAAPRQVPRQLILASAGSGKTFRISSTIIGLLAAGERPDEIFASTFTRSAAGEILERVLIRLATAALDDGAALALAKHAGLLDDDATRPRGFGPLFWTGLLEDVSRSLHRMNIGTLDAFFMRTAYSFAQEVGLPQTWSIADDSAADRIRSLALQDVLAGTEPTVLLELVRRLARNEGSRSVHAHLLRRVKLLMTFHYALDPRSDDHWCGFDALAAQCGTNPAAHRGEIAARLAAVAIPRTRGNAERKSWRANVDRLGAAIAAGDWPTFTDNTLVQRAREGGSFDTVPVPPDVAAILDDAWLLARADVARMLSERCHALRRFAALYEVALDRRRVEAGAYEFDDVTRVLGGPDPLGSRTDMYYRLDAQTTHILLDEFQDTSAPQWEALEPLADELMSGHEEERSAVIVADPKQSIYGWRGGSPDLVDALREKYVLGSDVLAKSWRSSQVVLDFINDLYGRFDELSTWLDDDAYREVAADWLRAFSPHTAARDLDGHVIVRVGPADEGSSEDRPRLCRHAAEHVAALHDRMPGFSIGVLTRTNAAVARMMMYLKQAGVHASEEGGNPLTDAAPVTAVLALLRLADHPGHTVARYHVARTPIGHALGFTDHRDDEAARSVAARVRRRLLDDGYGSTIAAIAASMHDDCSDRERRRLDQLVELAFRYESGATLRPSDFVRYVRREKVEDPIAADVRVMTIHQAKGLEFDIVVLPELDAPFVRNRPSDLVAFRPEPGARITRAFPFVRKSLARLFPELTELAQAHRQTFQGQLRDGLSTMYVGLTRARHALHIIIKPDNGTARSGARILRQALVPAVPAVEGRILIERGNPDWHLSRLPPQRAHAPTAATGAGSVATPRAATNLVPMRVRTSDSRARTLPRRSPSDLEGGPRVDLGMMLRLGGSAAARRGSLVHRWLEHVGWIEDGVPADDQLEVLARTVDPAIDDAELALLRARFREWLAHPGLAGVLSSARHAPDSTVQREVPFLTREGDVVLEGFIDRLVLTREHGRVVAATVIDFKTDVFAANDAALARRIDHYTPQIAAYRRAVAAMYGLAADRVTGRLVFLEPCVIVDA